MDRPTGKITALSSDHGQGVVTTVGGIRLAFTCLDAAGAAGFAEGQIVTYTDVQDGPFAPAAADVRTHG